jgi:hypothetical protein
VLPRLGLGEDFGYTSSGHCVERQQNQVPHMTHPTLPPGIRDLPVPDRVALVGQIWDSIVEDEARFELAQRLIPCIPADRGEAREESSRE